MIHKTESESPQPVAEAESLVGVAMHDLLAVLAPVLDWYQSDEEAARPPMDILRDIVDDLQSDRKAALVASSAATDALALCHQIEKCGCSPELTEASLMASRLRAKLSAARDQALPRLPDSAASATQKGNEL